MAFLNSIEQLRAVEWGAKYLWDIKFEGAPSPFDLWFPASDVDEELANLDSYAVESSQNSFKVPRTGTALNLRITFFDDARFTLLNWMTNWVNKEILNDGKHVSTLETCIKQVTVIKLNSRKEIIKKSSYWVYPDGLIAFNGSSTPDSQQYSIPFVIVGRSGV